jgi:hypothetical protein
MSGKPGTDIGLGGASIAVGEQLISKLLYKRNTFSAAVESLKDYPMWRLTKAEVQILRLYRQANSR